MVPSSTPAGPEPASTTNHTDVAEVDGPVFYTPRELNTLISRVVAEAVAERLHDRASYHLACAAALAAGPRPDADAQRAIAWHRGEAVALHGLAARDEMRGEVA